MQACAAIVTRISSVISRPPQPSKSFSARKTRTWPRSSVWSSGGSRRNMEKLRPIMDRHSGGKSRARHCRRRRCFKNENIVPESYLGTRCIEEGKLDVKLTGLDEIQWVLCRAQNPMSRQEGPEINHEQRDHAAA